MQSYVIVHGSNAPQFPYREQSYTPADFERLAALAALQAPKDGHFCIDITAQTPSTFLQCHIHLGQAEKCARGAMDYLTNILAQCPDPAEVDPEMEAEQQVQLTAMYTLLEEFTNGGH